MIVDPDEFIKKREDLILGFTDQDPFRFKLIAGKTLYLRSECKTSKDKCKGSYNQFERAAQVLEAASNDGLTQLRGQHDVGAEKVRITVELCQIVRYYLHPTKDPVGEIGLTLVIIPGVHARLSNISDDHRFIERGEFV